MAKNFSNKKQQTLIEQFLNEEPLFLLLYDELNILLASQDIRFSLAEIWYDAKEFVKSIFQSNHPDKLLSTYYHQLEDEYKKFNPIARDFGSPMMPVLKEDISQGEQNSAVNMIILSAICILYYECHSENDVNIIKVSTKMMDYLRNDYCSFYTAWFPIIKEEGDHDISFYSFNYRHDIKENSTIKGTDTQINREEVKTTEKEKLPLKQYMNDPVYSQCYAGMVSVLSSLSYVNGREYTPDDYATIFAEAEGYVNEVMQSDYPEMNISNIQSRIKKKYDNRTTEKGPGGQVMTTISNDEQIGCLVEMIFVIALCDKMEVKSQLVQNALKASRVRFEYAYMPNPYVENPMWKLIAERIPPFDRKQVADCEVEIAHLKEAINEKDKQMAEKEEELEQAHAGWIKSEEGFTTYDTNKRIQVLKHLLHIGNSLDGDERAQFKKLCLMMTKSTDSNLEKLLSQNSLTTMESNLTRLLGDYPILKMSSQPQKS